MWSHGVAGSSLSSLRHVFNKALKHPSQVAGDRWLQDSPGWRALRHRPPVSLKELEPPFSLDHLTGLQKARRGLDLSLAVSAQRHVSEAHRKPPPRSTGKLRGVGEEVLGRGVSFNAPTQSLLCGTRAHTVVVQKGDKHRLQRLQGPKPVSWLRRGTYPHFLTHGPPLAPPRPTQLNFSRAGRTQRRSSEHPPCLCPLPLTPLPSTQMLRVETGSLPCAPVGVHLRKGCNKPSRTMRLKAAERDSWVTTGSQKGDTLSGPCPSTCSGSETFLDASAVREL